MILNILVFFATLSYFVYNYFTRTLNYWKDKNVVGPQPIPFFGNFKEVALRRKNHGVLFKETYQNYPNEKVVGFHRMTTPCLLIRDPDIIKHILVKDFDLFHDRGVEYNEKKLGTNLFHADGDIWRVLRNRFTPMFTSGKLKNMLYLVNERGERLVDYINDTCENQMESDVHSLIQKFTVASISACVFGIDVNPFRDNIETFKKIDALTWTPSYAQELDLLCPGILRTLRMSLFSSFLNDTFDSLAKNVMKQRNGVISDRKDFMDLILELKQQGEVQGPKRNSDVTQLKLEFTDEIIAAQAFVFYVGGYETSATTMAFMLYELAENPEVQDKVIAEIDQVLESHDGKITYESLNEFVYMDRIFSEVLRMYPVVDPLQRRTQVDYQVPGTDLTIEKDTRVLISCSGLHYDEKYFPNPTKFDPERFNPENSKDRHSCAYLPFGIGPRNCIGMRFSKLQSRVCIAMLLSKFRVEKSEKTQKVMGINPKRAITGPHGGIFLNVVKR